MISKENMKIKIINEIKDEEKKLENYIEAIEKEISTIKKRIIIKEEYLNKLCELTNKFN